MAKASWNITYKHKQDDFYRIVSATVYLDGKCTGIIKKLGADEWRYFPKGHEPGEAFATLELAKNSLEEE